VQPVHFQAIKASGAGKLRVGMLVVFRQIIFVRQSSKIFMVIKTFLYLYSKKIKVWPFTGLYPL